MCPYMLYIGKYHVLIYNNNQLSLCVCVYKLHHTTTCNEPGGGGFPIKLCDRLMISPQTNWHTSCCVLHVCVRACVHACVFDDLLLKAANALYNYVYYTYNDIIL